MRSHAGKLPISRHLAAAIAATALLGAFEIYLFQNYYSGFRVLRHVENGLFIAPLKTLVMAGAAFLISGLFFYFAFKAPYWLRPAYFALFVLGSLAEYGYQWNFSRFTISEDLANIFFAADGRIFFESAATYFTPAAIVPCLIFAVLLAAVRPNDTGEYTSGLVFPLIFLGFFVLPAYVTSSAYPTPAFAAFYRTLVGFPINWYVGSLTQPALATFYAAPREPVGYTSPVPPANNIVLIVDESVRADHLSINGYTRSTTPFLEELEKRKLVANWGIAVSAATCSINSNNVILTGISELPDIKGRVYQAPTIFQYARAMGYKVHYYDGQTSFRWLGKSNDLEPADRAVWAHELQHGPLYDTDAEIARLVRDTVETSSGNFIWINKFGVHPPYANSYPASSAQWLPVPAESRGLFTGGRDSQARVNDYDNALTYNSQSFFSNLIGPGPPANTVYIYTSDHAQNLGEGGRTLTHCSNTRYEAMVPLLMIGRAPAAEPETAFLASHVNIFATLLDLMNYPKEHSLAYPLSLLRAKAADSKPRFYFEGNLNSRFGNSMTRFDP